MKKLAIVALLVAGPALAEDTRHTIFADSAVVANLRPVALAGALKRLGTGWERLVRDRLPLPGAVSPFDPAVLALTGIDPAGVVWLGMRPLRGGLHVRAALPLVEVRVADALVHTLGSALHATIDRGATASWTTRLGDGTPLVARLDGSTLVIDGVLPNATMMPTPADVMRVVPLRPPRAFAGTRGTQKRMTASDAFALWADLDAVARLGQQQSEAKMSQAMKSVAPAMRAQVSKAGQAELARCKTSMNALPHSFDDVLFAVTVTSPDQLRIGLAEGGRKLGLDALRVVRTPPSHTLPDCADADLCLQAVAPPIPKLGAHHELQSGCSDVAAVSEIAWGWPALLGTDDHSPWLMVLRGVRALSFAIPGADEPIVPQRFIAAAELDASVRGDIDRLLSSLHFDATSPIQVDGRSLTTWTPPSYGGEPPVVALDPGAGATTVGALGPRALVRTTLEKVIAKPVPMTSTAATMTLSARGLRRLGKIAGADVTLVDGVTQVAGALVLDDDVVHLDTDVTLKR